VERFFAEEATPLDHRFPYPRAAERFPGRMTEGEVLMAESGKRIHVELICMTEAEAAEARRDRLTAQIDAMLPD
jgi:hypothetical protein